MGVRNVQVDEQHPLTKREVDWAISRMRRILEIWDRKLEAPEKKFILRRIRDRESALFYSIAQEK
jgi:hypothetical protein